MNMKRVLTTVIGLPIIIAILILGNKYLIDFIVAFVGVIAMYEYSKACKQKDIKVIPWISYLSVFSIAFIHIVSIETLNFVVTLGVPIILVILFLHAIVTNMKISFKDISYTLFGILYILCFLMFIALTYGIEGKYLGKILIWYIFIAAWGTDIFAYLVGKHFGKHKFSKVSPNKTVEGCLSGVIATAIFSLIFTYFINKYMSYELSYITIFIISMILSAAGQIGDFSESVIKRYFDIKDTSNLFPGHGGMLDRIDSLMFIAPFAYFLLTFFL